MIDELYDDIIEETSNDIKNLFENVRYRTPIDTGAARASYKLSLQSFNKAQTNVTPYDFSEIKRNLKKDNLALYSTCPYLGKLEDGHSKQAPFGFIEISLAEFINKHKRL